LTETLLSSWETSASVCKKENKPLSFLTLTSVMHFLCNCLKKQTECSLCKNCGQVINKSQSEQAYYTSFGFQSQKRIDFTVLYLFLKH